MTLLIPAYNEEAVLERFLDAALGSAAPDWELLVVDDGSADRTGDIADAAAQSHDSVRVIHHSRNRGLGGALATGFRNAQGDVVVTIDADLSHPLDLVPRMVAETAHSDVVFASRFIAGGSMLGVPQHRVLISTLANRVLRVLLRTQTHDLTTGLRAYRRPAVQSLDLRATGFAVQLEITVRLEAAGCRAVEVPLVLGNRAAGESKMRYLQLLPRYAAVTASLLWLRWGVGRGAPARRARVNRSAG